MFEPNAEWVAPARAAVAYDLSAYPLLDADWIANADATCVRNRVVARMRELGVFAEP